MKAGQLARFLKASALSPEKAAGYFAISNMTIRRLLAGPGDAAVPEYAARSIRDGIDRLMVEGRIAADLKAAHVLLDRATPPSSAALLKRLGVAGGLAPGDGAHRDHVIRILTEIGSDDRRLKTVLDDRAKLRWFSKLGPEWAPKVAGLLKIARAARAPLLGRSVAVGALFYLIVPTDLIPDALPVVGVVDDYGFLSLAALYYAAKGEA